MERSRYASVITCFAFFLPLNSSLQHLGFHNARRWGELHAWVLGRSSCFPWISHPVHFNLASAVFHGVTACFELEGTLGMIQFHPLPWPGTPSSSPSPSGCDSVIVCGNELFSSFPCHPFPQSPKQDQTLDFGSGKADFCHL